MPFLDETGLKRVWSKVKSLISNESSARASAVSAEQTRATKAENNIVSLISGSPVQYGNRATKSYAKFERFVLNGNQLCRALKPISKGETLTKDSNYMVEPISQALYKSVYDVESFNIAPGQTNSFSYEHTVVIYSWYNSLYTPSSIPKILPGNVSGSIHVTINGTDGLITVDSNRRTFTNHTHDTVITIIGIGNVYSER